jgi:hypothetical protein
MSGLGSLSLSLFGSSGSSRSTIQPLDLSSLTQASTPVQIDTPPDPRRLTPWDSNVTKPDTDRLAREALADRFLVRTNLGTGPGSSIRSNNDRQLFILHNALSRLSALTEKMTSSGLSAQERTRYSERVDRGLREIQEYARTVKLDDAVLLGGRRLNDHRTEPLSRPSGKYQTRPLATGATDTVPEAFLGERRFQVAVTRDLVTTNVTIDLANMGTTPRTLTNVAAHINQTLNDAGFATRINKVETKVAPAVKGGAETIEQRFEVALATGERASFNALAPRQPALSVAGVTVDKDNKISSALHRLTALDGTTDKRAFQQTASAQTGNAIYRAMARDSEGNTFVVADITGRMDGMVPKAGQDAVLRKIDSNGQVVWSRPLGAGASASGATIAIGQDGRIAIAGHVDGRLENTTRVTGDGRDSYVAVFDDEGRDLWFHQQGGLRSDSASHVAFAADGTLYMAGTSTEGYGGSDAKGGVDAYVQAFSATGEVLWTQSFGDAGNDTPAGLIAGPDGPRLVWNQADGARMAQLSAFDGSISGTVRNLAGDGLRRVTAVSADSTGALAIAGGAGGETQNDQVRIFDAAGTSVTGSVSTNGEPIRALALSDGQIAVALGAGNNATTGEIDRTRSVIRGFNATTGAQAFSRTVNVDSRQPISLDLGNTQDETLEALGLPSGALKFGDTDLLTDRTGLRPGDSFSIVVNGNRERRIDIAAGETLRTLSTKINRVLVNDGRAEVMLSGGANTLRITPARGDRIELRAGRATSDALAQLGLEPGLAMERPRAAGATRSVSDPPPVVSLELPEKSDTSNVERAKSFRDAIEGALRRIRIGYREISTDPTMVELRKQTSGAAKTPSASQGAITYFNQQAANGQEALRRLGVSA